MEILHSSSRQSRAFVGLFLGRRGSGIMCRNLQRAATCAAAVGLGIGFAGGIVAIFIAEIIYGIMSLVAVSISKDPVDEGGTPTGVGFLFHMIGRAAAWAVAAVPAGIGQGNRSSREWKVVVNGLLGGVLGGLAGRPRVRPDHRRVHRRQTVRPGSAEALA